MMIRVLIADDHHLVRAGIHALLEKTDDIQVVAEAGDGLEAVELARELRPHVVVMDIGKRRPGYGRSIAAVKWSSCRCIRRN